MGAEGEEEHLLGGGLHSAGAQVPVYAYDPPAASRGEQVGVATPTTQGGSRSFVVQVFPGNPDTSKVFNLLCCGFCCVFILAFLTLGLLMFCCLPIIVCCVFYHARKEEETITFNNETQMLESRSFPRVPYGGVRIEARFIPRTSSVAVYIFMDELKPLPITGMLRTRLMLPSTPQDPKFELPLRDLDVLSLRDRMREISTFSGIPARDPPIAWEEIQVIVSNADAARRAEAARRHHHH